MEMGFASRTNVLDSAIGWWSCLVLEMRSPFGGSVCQVVAVMKASVVLGRVTALEPASEHVVDGMSFGLGCVLLVGRGELPCVGRGPHELCRR